jgi:putative intracellular protease/amidase
MREVVEGSGGEWHEHSNNPMSEYVEVSDRIVTGMNPASAAGVAEAMIKMLPQNKK